MNSCLENYRTNVNEIDKDTILNYWMEFFPGKKKEDINNLIRKISNKNMEDLFEKYEEENLTLGQIVSLFSDIEINEDRNVVDNICETIYKENRWVYFFKPILYKRIGSLIKQMDSSAIIVDKQTLLLSVLTDITDKLAGQCYRVLTNVLNTAAEEKLLVGEDSKARGKYFCNELLQDMDYVKGIYLSYPELFKAMDRTAVYNINYVSEIIANTEQEFEIIKKKFGKNEKFGKLYKIRLGTGDSHNNGRTVAGLVFEDEQKLMYKPRSLKMEDSYCKLIDWINQNISITTGLSYCRIHEVENAGWVEFVENEPCTAMQEVQQFYEKMGEILCVLYTLNAKDFHCENIIAKGNQPMLIDMETLIHVDEIERVRDWDSVEEKIGEYIQHSVYSTALLPTVLTNYNTEDCMEVGGIGSARKRISPFRTQILENIDSDKVSIGYEYKEVPLNQNFPILNGEKIGAGGYFTQVKDGFIRLYQWILGNKEQYIEKIRELFQDAECRVIYKGTNNYTQLLNTSYHPSLLHNEVDRQVYFHRIGLLFNKDENLSNLFQDEIKAMINGDVPVYFMDAQGKSVRNNEGIEVYTGYKKSPLDKVVDKIRSMSNLDLKRQVSMIYFSFIGCEIDTDKENGTGVEYKMAGTNSQNTSFVEFAKCIAQEMSQRSFSQIIDGKEQVGWFGFQGMGEHGYAISPLKWEMYSGNYGVAMYYFRMYEVTKNEAYKTLAKSVLASAERNMRNITNQELELMGIGAFTGFTGHIYMFCKIVERGWLAKEEQKEWEEVIDNLVTYLHNNMEKEERVDVLTGIAGVLGVMVSLYTYVTGELQNKTKAVMEKAVQILIDRVIELDEDKVTWFDNGDIGYVHGNAGIMAHLIRANRILKDDRIIKVVEKALKYEREDRFDEEKKVWRLRESTHYFSWCNGVAGMSLAKIMMLENGYEDDQLERELALMKRQISETGFGFDMSLCHGDMGSLTVLKYIARYFKDIPTINNCKETCQLFVKRRMEEHSLFALDDWGMMTGISGVGLGMLEQEESDSEFLAMVMSLR